MKTDGDMIELACQTVALSIISDLLSREGSYDWGDYPEIGEHDWDEITALVRRAAADVRLGPLDMDTASAILVARASS